MIEITSIETKVKSEYLMSLFKLILVSLLLNTGILLAAKPCYLIIQNFQPESNSIDTVKISWVIRENDDALFLNFNSDEEEALLIEQGTIEQTSSSLKFRVQKREDDSFFAHGKHISLDLKPANIISDNLYKVTAEITGGSLTVKTFKKCSGHTALGGTTRSLFQN